MNADSSDNEIPPGRRRRVGPRYGVERELRNFWSRILGHRDFGVHDNFFEIGGDSMQAVQVLAWIESEFGYEISLAALLEAPTIAGIAMLLRGGATTAVSSLVPIRKTGSRPPVFCFHPLGGSVARYYSLARALGSEQPLYGLQALGLIEGQRAQDNLGEMAATYVNEILSAQPAGPHRLVGYSLGGVIAFVAAQLLLDHTGVQPFLTCIDTATCYPHLREPDLPYRAVAEFALKTDLDPGVYRGLAPEDALRQIYEQAVCEGVIGYEFSLDRLMRIFDTVSANARAVSGYQLRGYAGEVVLIRSDRAGEHLELPNDLGWSHYAQSVTTHFLGLGHLTILEPKGASRIAAVLQRQAHSS